MSATSKSKKKNIASSLLDWYDRARRDLPWRAKPGEQADPYHVWLSEIMLQQTTVKTVGPYYATFLKNWPTVKDLAAADEEDVLRAWAGLGYYARARNLHKAAIKVSEELDGIFPCNEKDLLALPGVGPYTAAAIAAIAYDEPATVVDGNVERVVSRLFALQTSLPAVKPEIKQCASTLTPKKRPGDYAQAMMDLGASLCSPTRPSCLLCPINKSCDAHEQGIAETLPRRAPKSEKPTRYGIAFLAIQEDDHVLLRKRPEKGLLAKMTEVPSTDWGEKMPSEVQAKKMAPLDAEWEVVPGSVTHTFTHFHLELRIYRSILPEAASLKPAAKPDQCRWVARTKLGTEALPTVMKKIIAHGLR